MRTTSSRWGVETSKTSHVAIARMRCTVPGGIAFNEFDVLNDCYKATTTCATPDCAQVDVNFGYATNTFLARNDYKELVTPHGGNCQQVSIGNMGHNVPGFHFYKYNSQNWWRWDVRTTAECAAGSTTWASRPAHEGWGGRLGCRDGPKTARHARRNER